MGDIFLGTRKIPPWKIARAKIPNHVNSHLKIPTHSDSSGRLPSPPRIIPNYIHLNSTLKNAANENSPPLPPKKMIASSLYKLATENFPKSLTHACSLF